MPRSWNNRIKTVFSYSFCVLYGMRKNLSRKYFTVSVQKEKRKYFAFEKWLKYNVKNRHTDSPPKTVNGSDRFVETSIVFRHH